MKSPSYEAASAVMPGGMPFLRAIDAIDGLLRADKTMDILHRATAVFIWYDDTEGWRWYVSAEKEKLGQGKPT